jgi:DNA-directed RNA polymerase specialized sigma24 family protein
VCIQNGNIFMGPFTAWIEQWRKNRELPMPPELAEKLAEVVFGSVVRRLRAAITPRFGIPDAHDLVSEQYLALLGYFDDPNRSLTVFVKDTQTLTHWLYRESWSRFCRVLQKRSIERGPSALAGGPSAAAGMEGIEDYRSELNSQDLEIKELIEQSLADMNRLGIPDARTIFEKIIFQQQTQKQVGEELDVHHTTVGRRLEACKFCFVRRLGWSKKQLEDEFGEDEVSAWTRDLKTGSKHGGK